LPRAKSPRDLALNRTCPIWMYGRIGNSLVTRRSDGFVDSADAEAKRDALVARAKADRSVVPTTGECVERYPISKTR
jgi:zona occludens toxin (predicted ATPase)